MRTQLVGGFRKLFDALDLNTLTINHAKTYIIPSRIHAYLFLPSARDLGSDHLRPARLLQPGQGHFSLLQGMAGIRRVRPLPDRLRHLEHHGLGRVRRERRQTVNSL